MFLIFAADQTPTPTTRLIRNCEEFGLFDDLKHVNPFEETFRQAIDGSSKPSTISMTTQKSLELIKCNDEETLHTPIPLKYTTNADKEKKPTNDSSAEKSSQSHAATPPTKVTRTPAVRRKVNWPTAADDNSEKPLDTTKKRASLRKIHPKPVVVSTINTIISNPIKEKIRQSLLKYQTMHNVENATIGRVATVNKDVLRVENKPKIIRTKKANSNDSSANERNREAAKRYRNKQKILHDKLLVRNAQLEAEVVRLKHQLEMFKKAHEKCSVTQNAGTLGNSSDLN